MSTTELKIKEYQADIEELNNLLNQSLRTNVKQFLVGQKEKLEVDLSKLQKSEEERLARLSQNRTPITGYTKKIDSYGWDQSDKFVKIYITCLKELNKITQNDLVCNISEKSFDLTVKNLNNVNYNLSVNNLLDNIDPSQSYAKLKTDMIAVFLKKSQTGKNWEFVTEKEKKVKEKSTPKLDENIDPQEGLMSMMKKMYDEGDDEMKRTISKAFSESREKQMKGDMGGMDF